MSIMQDQHVPVIGRYYWPVLAAATLFGSNAGDLLVRQLTAVGLGEITLPLLAVAFAGILYVEARDQTPTKRWYWLAVIIMPTAAGHLADLSYLYLGVRRIWVCLALLGMLVVAHLAFQSDTTRLIALRLQQRPQPTVPITDATYWIAMVLAGTAGTLASDFLKIGLALGLPVVCLLLAALLTAAAAMRRWSELNRTLTYWMVVFALNAVGTAIGDLLQDGVFGMGLAPSVVITGVLLVLLLLLVSSGDRARQRAR